MKPLEQLDQLARSIGLDDRRDLLNLLARESARQAFRRRNPAAGDAQVEAYVLRFWRAYREQAAEAAAVMLAAGEIGRG